MKSGIVSPSFLLKLLISINVLVFSIDTSSMIQRTLKNISERQPLNHSKSMNEDWLGSIMFEFSSKAMDSYKTQSLLENTFEDGQSLDFERIIPEFYTQFLVNNENFCWFVFQSFICNNTEESLQIIENNLNNPNIYEDFIVEFAEYMDKESDFKDFNITHKNVEFCRSFLDIDFIKCEKNYERNYERFRRLIGCAANCADCSSGTKCDICYENASPVSNNQMDCACPNYSYSDVSTQSCIYCGTNCMNCNSSGCTQCMDSANMINNLDGSCSCQQTTCLCPSGYSWSKFLNLCAPIFGIAEFQVLIEIQNGDVAQAIITIQGYPLDDSTVFEFLVDSLINYTNSSYGSLCDFYQVVEAAVVLMSSYPEYLTYEFVQELFSLTNFTADDYSSSFPNTGCSYAIDIFLTLCNYYLNFSQNYLNGVETVDLTISNFLIKILYYEEYQYFSLEAGYNFSSSFIWWNFPVFTQINMITTIEEGGNMGCSDSMLVAKILIQYQNFSSFSDIISINYYQSGTIVDGSYNFQSLSAIPICSPFEYDLATYSITSTSQACIYFNPCQIVSKESEFTKIVINTAGFYTIGFLIICDQGLGPNNNGDCVSCYDQNCLDCNFAYKYCIDCSSSDREPMGGLCNYPCKTNCLRCYLGECTQCVDSQMILNSDGSCSFDCKNNCIECNNSYSGCDHCYLNAVYNGSDCVCPDYSYSNSTLQACVACGNNCQQCDKNGCVLCINTDMTINKNGSCSYIANTTCPINSTLQNNTCVCNTSFYMDTPQQKCLSCGSSCLQCNGPSNCSSCYSNADLINNSCSCRAGFYFNNSTNQCTVCDSTCLSCSGGSNTNCLSCSNNAFLINSSCVCNASYYWDSSINSCSKCFYQCSACNGPSSNDCTSCYSNAGLNYNSCSCHSGYYWNTSINQCAVCDPSCLSCSGGSNTNCLSCLTSAVLNNNSCICKNGYYWNITFLNCSKCSSKCLTCSSYSENSCLSCPSNLILQNSGSCSCNTSFYMNTLQNECLSCDSSCLTCFEGLNTTCLSCFDGVKLINNSCRCNNGYYLDTYNKTCTKCYSQCLNCSGGSNTDCLSCFDNAKILNDRSCTCNDGYYWNFTLNKCMNCSSPCFNCINESNTSCLSCLGNSLLQKNSCVCSLGSYWDSLASNCLACSPFCSSCVGSSQNNCTACRENFNLLSDSSCLCKTGFELYNYSCQCIQNSQYDVQTGNCDCIKGYIFVNNKYCAIKANYFYPSEISGFYAADYKSIVINFQRQVGQSLTQINCNNTLKSFSISFNGLVGTCVWTSSTSMTIQYATIISPQNLIISLNPLQVQAVGNVSNLNIYELNINIDIVYPLPTPTAQLSIPSLVSLGCGNQTLVFSTKSISPDYSYSWSSISDPVNTILLDYLSNQISYFVTVPSDYLTNGTTVINITITSTTFTTSNWTTSSIIIINEKQLSVVLNVGNNFSYKPQSSLAIKPQVLNSCGYTGIFSYKWFNTASPEGSLDFDSIWLANSSNPAVLFISSGTLQAGLSYSFTAIVYGGSLSGSVQ